MCMNASTNYNMIRRIVRSNTNNYPKKKFWNWLNILRYKVGDYCVRTSTLKSKFFFGTNRHFTDTHVFTGKDMFRRYVPNVDWNIHSRMSDSGGSLRGPEKNWMRTCTRLEWNKKKITQKNTRAFSFIVIWWWWERHLSWQVCNKVHLACTQPLFYDGVRWLLLSDTCEIKKKMDKKKRNVGRGKKWSKVQLVEKK